MAQGHHFQLRRHALSFIILNSLTLRLLQLIILSSRRRQMTYNPRVPLNHKLVVLGFTKMYLWFLNTLGLI